MRLLGRFVTIVPAALAAVMVCSTPARPAGGDSPVPNFPEAKQTKRSVKALESYWIPVGKLFGDGQAEKVEVVEGRWTHTSYTTPAKRSVVEIGRHYDQGLRNEGFEIVYSCRDGDCGTGGRKTNGDWWDPNFMRRYIVGRQARPEGDLWVCVHAQAKGPNLPAQLELDVIQAKPEPRVEEVKPDETDAGWLESELVERGHVAVRGVSFDPKKLTVLPESQPVLQAISQLMARDPRRKLLVVVHSDGATDVAASVQRSRKQAGALVTTMVKKFSVPAARVRGEGVGPLAPLTTNATQEGRATNRRIELVLVNPLAERSLKATQTE